MDHIVDKLIFKDIQLTASNDDQYFVFEDVLYQLMLCFSRDAQIPSLIPSDPTVTKGRHYDIPPSGIIPFHGICMFGKWQTLKYIYSTFNYIQLIILSSYSGTFLLSLQFNQCPLFYFSRFLYTLLSSFDHHQFTSSS